MNYEFPDVQAGFRKGRGTGDQLANIFWIIKKAREFQENIYFCFTDYTKVFNSVDHHKLWKILKEMGLPDHLTCLLRNLYADQEATVRTGHGTTDWFQIGKGVCQGFAEYIVWNARLDEHKLESRWLTLTLTLILISISRNISNLRYADDTTLMAESKEELKEPLDESEREWKSWLKNQHSEN